MERATLVIGLAGLLVGCTAQPDARPPSLIAAFSDMSEASFSVEATAPPETIREYAICKATWFAEKKQAKRMSLSDPVYGPPQAAANVHGPVPSGWLSLKTTAYLTVPYPPGTAAFDVGEKAAQCRQMWDWFR